MRFSIFLEKERDFLTERERGVDATYYETFQQDSFSLFFYSPPDDDSLERPKDTHPSSPSKKEHDLDSCEELNSINRALLGDLFDPHEGLQSLAFVDPMPTKPIVLVFFFYKSA